MTAHRRATQKEILEAFQAENCKFEDCYVWLENAMPDSFFDEISPENIRLISYGLMGFPLQDYFTMINLKNAALVMCLDSADADLRILANYAMYGIKNYLAFV